MRQWLILFLVYLTVNVYGQQLYRNPDIPLSNSMGIFRIIHVVSSQKSETYDANIGEKIGTVEKYPEKLSDKFDREIRLSINYYGNKNFDSARTILESAMIIESKNPFILDNYARACYYVDRPTSFNVYKKLISQLDSTYQNSDSLTVVDIWFRDAYWKLGTLYMDNKEWRNAYYDISRFLGAIQESKGKKVYIQALEYLTECAFNSYDDKLADYLANRVLVYDKQSEYAHKVLTEIKK